MDHNIHFGQYVCYVHSQVQKVGTRVLGRYHDMSNFIVMFDGYCSAHMLG